MNGGLAGFFWALIWTYTGRFFIILSLAEMASRAPTAGGQHHYVSEFSSRRWQRPLSYCAGWFSTISWQSNVAVNCHIIAGITQALFEVNNPTFEPTKWMQTLLTIFFVGFIAAFNTFAAGHLSFIEGVFATCHVFALVPICVTLWVMVSPKTPAPEVFVHFRDHTASWPSTGLSVLVGQVSAIFTIVRSDGIAYMAEEVERAAEVVPRGMIWAYFLNLPLTLIMYLTYAFNIGSVGEALDADYPIVRVLQMALGNSSAVTAFTILVLVLLVMITINCLAATSRQAFAFARDGGLPFSNWISQVSPRFELPVNAIIFTAGYTTALSLITMSSTVALATLLALSSMALMATYVLSIGCIVLGRINGRALPRARWPLGKAGLPVNCIALAYAIWSFFWCLWPDHYHVGWSNFNWACALLAGFMGIGGVLYHRGPGHKYEGPVAKVQGWMHDW